MGPGQFRAGRRAKARGPDAQAGFRGLRSHLPDSSSGLEKAYLQDSSLFKSGPEIHKKQLIWQFLIG